MRKSSGISIKLKLITEDIVALEIISPLSGSQMVRSSLEFFKNHVIIVLDAQPISAGK